MATPETLGFIGLGVMGGRMCRNLAQKSGRPVIGYDIVSDRVEALADAGVKVGENPTEAGELMAEIVAGL